MIFQSDASRVPLGLQNKSAAPVFLQKMCLKCVSCLHTLPQAVAHECAPPRGITQSHFSHNVFAAAAPSAVLIWEEESCYDCAFDSVFTVGVCVVMHVYFILLLFFFRRSRRQDIIHGNPLTQCRGFNLKGNFKSALIKIRICVM